MISSADQLTKNKIIDILNDKISKITFKGKNNILYLDGDVKLTNCKISFLSNNTLIYLTGQEKQDCKVRIKC